MDLARAGLDVGLFTERRDEALAFWGDAVGLAGGDRLAVGSGVQQYRFELPDGGVLKVNHSRDPLPEVANGFVALRIAVDDVRSPVALVDPDGLTVELVPPDDAAPVELTWRCAEPGELRGWLERMLGAEAHPDGRVEVAGTLVRLEQDDAEREPGPLRARGARYLTVQVADCPATHAALVAAGVAEARAPVRLGDVAVVSFVRLPDGGWLEVSQRRSITGALPELPEGRL
ncbi:MAG: VOC family protein [Actinomycetota bacterium]|nr:VOC family protein [Actinomycetota bacterium]